MNKDGSGIAVLHDFADGFNAASDVVWTTAPGAPADNGTNKAVLLNIEAQTPARFYRLRQ